MKIQPTSETNLKFEKLHAPKELMLQKTGKISKKQLLKSDAIKECSNKYDVYIKKGKQNGQIETSRNTLIGAGVGSLLGGIAAIATISLNAPVVLGIFFGAIYTLIGIALGTVKPHETPTYEYCVKGENGNIKTREHRIVTLEDINNIPNLTKEIETKQKQ